MQGVQDVLLITAVVYASLVPGACVRRGHQEIEDTSPFGPPCKSYAPTKCGLLHRSGLPKEPFCHPGNGSQHNCNFDTKSLKSCPLPTEGSFEKDVVTTQQCRLEVKALRRVSTQPTQPPTCGTHCCSVEVSGDFLFRRGKRYQNSLQFQPNATSCLYYQYNWNEVMACLGGSRVVIAGDSVMRQFFNMAVTMFRGQEVAMDYNKHAHGRYRVCQAGDKLEFGSFVPSRWEVPLQEIGPLFTTGNASFQKCSDKPITEIDYLWAPRFMDLVPNLREYQKVVAEPSGQKTVYITFAGFWEDRDVVADDFLETLDEIEASAEAIIMIGVPRTRLFGEPHDNAGIRNEKMRNYVKSKPASSSKVHFLDFDQLAQSQHAPPGMGSLNWHYQCFLDHLHLEDVKSAVGDLENAWYWSEAPDYIYPSVWTDEKGSCSDDMDRTLWQIVFNLLCNARSKPIPTDSANLQASDSATSKNDRDDTL